MCCSGQASSKYLLKKYCLGSLLCHGQLRSCSLRCCNQGLASTKIKDQLSKRWEVEEQHQQLLLKAGRASSSDSLSSSLTPSCLNISPSIMSSCISTCLIHGTCTWQKLRSLLQNFDSSSMQGIQSGHLAIVVTFLMGIPTWRCRRRLQRCHESLAASACGITKDVKKENLSERKTAEAMAKVSAWHFLQLPSQIVRLAEASWKPNFGNLEVHAKWKTHNKTLNHWITNLCFCNSEAGSIE